MLDLNKIIQEANEQKEKSQQNNDSSSSKVNGLFKAKRPNYSVKTLIFLNLLNILIWTSVFWFQPEAINLKNPSVYIYLILFMIGTIAINAAKLKKINTKVISLIIMPFVIIIGIGAYFSVSTWSIWDNGNAYYKQIGKVESLKKGEEKLFEFDKKRNYIVDQQMALKIADKKMGTGSLSSQYQLGEATLQQVKYKGEVKLFWVVNLEYNSFWTQFSNGSIKNVILVDANQPTKPAILLNKDIKNNKFNITLSKQGYLTQYLQRMVQFNNPFKMLTDYSFELDDNLRPHYIVTHYENTRGFAIKKVKGIVDIDLTTNKMKSYSLKNIPNWIDRINPIDLVKEQITNNGKYVHGIFNFSNKDKYTLTDQSDNFFYIKDEPFFISGITSPSSDQSLIGIMAKSLRSSKTYRINIEGAVENAAKSSAQGKVQNFGYKAINPIIVNSKGDWKYLVPLVDNESLIKKYAVVDINNYQNVDIYDDIDSFVSSNQKGSSENKDSKKEATSTKDIKEELKEKIKKISEELLKVNEQIEKIK